MIRYPDAFYAFLPDGFDGEFDWDFLREAWKGRIEPMDFDCVVERNGQFLVFETKRPQRDGSYVIKAGNAYTLQRLLTRPEWTVILVHGKLPQDITEFFVYHMGKRVKYVHPATFEDLRNECVRWRQMAESKTAQYFSEVYLGRRD